MMRIITAHNIFKGLFGILMCWYQILKNWSQKGLNLVQDGDYLFLAYFVGHFGYHSNIEI